MCFSKAPHMRSHRAPCSCNPRKVSIQLSSEQSVGDVWIAQLDRKRVSQARSSGCTQFSLEKTNEDCFYALSCFIFDTSACCVLIKKNFKNICAMNM